MKFIALLTLVYSFLAVGATYTNPERGFSFDYPSDTWEVVTEKSPTGNQTQGAAQSNIDKQMADRTLVTIQKKQAEDKYRSRFSVVVDDLKKFPGGGLAQLIAYTKHSTDFLKSQRFHILSTSDKKLPKLEVPAFEIVANQRDFGLTFRQDIFIYKNEAYLLTLATRTQQFSASAPETASFFETFRFAPKAEPKPKGK